VKSIRAFCLALLVIAALSLGMASAQDAPVEITFVHIFTGENDVRGATVRAIADAFQEQNPGVIVNIPTASGDYTELFNNALLAAEQGDAPTVVQIEEGLTQLAADSGYFTPISDLASAEQLAALEAINPVVRNYYNIGETVWSVPWNSSNPIMYYNKAIFAAAGLDTETPPATFAEVTAACEAIMALPDAPEACINWPMAAWFAEQWVAMQGGLLADNDNGRAARATAMLYDSPEMLEVVEWWDDLAERGFYTYSGTQNDYFGEGVIFLSQRSAMTINSTAGITSFMRFAGGIDLGFARLPIPDEDATNGVTVGGASVWISAGATPEQQQAAVDFIFFLTNKENDKLFHQASGYFPNRLDSIEELTAEGWFDENPQFRIALDQLLESAGNIANAGAVIGPSTDVRTILIEGFQSMIDGEISPAEAMAAARTRADAVLADYNALVGE
jgi:sn-glycerol 3-phosphate transport system substrate-binding protein